MYFLTLLEIMQSFYWQFEYFWKIVSLANINKIVFFEVSWAT